MTIKKTLVSIGACCKTRHQIDQFLKKRDQHSAVTSYFFDSLTGGNIEGVIDIVQRDFVLRADDMCVFEYDGKFVAGDRSSKLLFFHDFGGNHEWWLTRAQCESALEKNLDDSLRKYVYLGQKTAALLHSKKDVCLLYYGRGTEELFLNLQEVLQSKFGEKIMIVHVTDQKEEMPIEKGAIPTVFVDEANSPKSGTSRQWEGWDEAWDAALTTLF